MAGVSKQEHVTRPIAANQVGYIMHLSPGTTPRARVGDLTYVKSIASPLERMLGSNAPIRTVYFPLLSVNIDQIPLIRGMFIGQT
jgi:hypothetical protein